MRATVHVTVEPAVGSIVSYTIEPGPRTGTLEPSIIGPPALLKPYLHWWLRRHRTADAQKVKAILEADDG